MTYTDFPTQNETHVLWQGISRHTQHMRGLVSGAEFYQKWVFFIEFERYGFDKGSIVYLLKKNLLYGGD